MKRIAFLSVATVLLFLMDSCSTKFDVAAPYKNITVIYGFLDQADTAHYIRIQKAFLDNNKSALTMAQSADSNYYASLNVKIERINLYTNGGIHDTIHLNRVDLTAEGYPKQAGVFFNSPNYAYKFTGFLDPHYSYRIVVSNSATGEVDSAEAPVIIDTDPFAFNVPFLDDSNVNRAGLTFYRTPVTKADELSLGCTYTLPSSFGTYNFYGQTTPATVAQMILRFNWADSNFATQQITYHSSDHDLGLVGLENGSFDFTMKNIDVYYAIRTALGVAPANTVRLLNRCTILAYLGTPDYNTYQQIQQAQGTGLTGSEIGPIYTNIKGANVLGLFTSKGTRVGNISISRETVDSLIVSPILSEMKIRGTKY